MKATAAAAKNVEDGDEQAVKGNGKEMSRTA
jgi:hypothetical protein